MSTDKPTTYTIRLTSDDLSLLRTIVEQYRESAAEWHLNQCGGEDYEANKAKSDEVYERVGELLAKLDGATPIPEAEEDKR
jgi:hypothetical protein